MGSTRLALACTFVMSWSPVCFGQLFDEDFNVDPTANWTVNDPALSDTTVDFFYDYSLIGVPAAPNGSGTRGLKMTANNSGAVFSGFSVSPDGENFTGNYRLSFDLWQNYVGPLGVGGSGSTQLSTFGVATAGNVAFWAGADPKESVGFAVTLDGGSASDFRAYSSAAFASYPSGDPVYSAPDGLINGSDTYYSGFGGGGAPAAQIGLFAGQTGNTDPGEIAFVWRRVVIEVANNQATWFIDGLEIASVGLSGLTLGGGNIFFGHSDTNASSSTDANAATLNVTLIDNILVEEIDAPIEVYVDKVYSEPHPVADPEVEIALYCDGALVDGEAGFNTALTAGGRATFAVSGFPEEGVNCYALETAVPAGYVQDTSDMSCGDEENPGFSVGPDGTGDPVEVPVGVPEIPPPTCTITNRPTEALFTVDKQFSDGNQSLMADVTVACMDNEDGPGIVYEPSDSGQAGESTDFVATVKWFGGITSCTASEVDLVGYTQITDPGDDDCSAGQTIGDDVDNSCVIFNDQDPVFIEADKIYSSGGAGAVDFAVECTNLDDGGTVTPPTASASPGNPAVFEVNDFMWDGSTLCTVTEPVPPGGYWETANTCVALSILPSDDPVECGITNSPTRATFRVTKHFDDGNNVAEIEVSIDCNTGLILDQDKDLSDGEWVEFVVTDFTAGLLECTITEDGQAGYSGEYDNVSLGNIINDESCDYPAESITAETSAHECVITNSPDPVAVTIHKQWIVEGTADAFSSEFGIELYCGASNLTGPGAQHDGGNDWSGSDEGEGNESFTWMVTPLFPNSICTADEYWVDDYVEVDNPCGSLVISAGNGAECTITNTVFFEGIPTLSQFGMALLALLMLGVGFVSFRRFV